MRIGELAVLCECPIETIRYYEKIGLLEAAPRLDNGYRSYNETHKKYLRFILQSRALGFTQNEVRQLSDIAHQKTPSCHEVHELIVANTMQVQEKIKNLKKMEKALKRLELKCKNDTLDECPVIDELMQ